MINTEFQAAVQRRDDEIDLAEAALLYARDAYPELDPALYLKQLDEWAIDIRSDVTASSDPIAALNQYLFDDLHFAGNRRHYGDPRNSYLNQVIDRRLGLPITLSVLYMEIARRVGLTVEGVGLPGHFIVRYLDRGVPHYLDPFHQGRQLSVEDCRSLVSDLSDGALEFQPEMLEVISRRQILIRMLANLKNAYVQEQRFEQAVPVVERMLDLKPDDALQLRDLGLLHYQLENYGPALQALQHYLVLAGVTPDDPVQQVIADVHVRIARLN